MVKHLLFLRWWVIVCLTSVAAIFAYQLGAITELIQNDWTYISPTIFVCFAFMSIWCGIKTFLLSKSVYPLVVKEKINEIELQEDIGWFAAESFQILGFIGTICGMIFALKGFAGIDLADVAAVQGLISNLVSGVSVAFYTTLTGLVASLLLKIQYFNLSYARRKVDK